MGRESKSISPTSTCKSIITKRVWLSSDFFIFFGYWYILQVEGSEVVTNCNQLKMKASDRKMRATDVADNEIYVN